MTRGRKAIPDEIKELRGNPGKRRLKALDHAANPAPLDDAKPDVPRAAAAPLHYPEFLTGDREKEIYRRIVEDYLQRRIARNSDLASYARWATYLHRWMLSKERLGDNATWYESDSNHGKMFRRHPIFKDMLDLERVMQSLEDRLGLNPVARQNIIHRLSVMPAALGGLFDEPAPDAPSGEAVPEPTPMPAASALGFVQNPSGKLN